MEDLDHLSNQECDLVRQLSCIQGPIESRESQIISAGIPEKYFSIYKSYFDRGHFQDNLEALKRTIFLQWYAASEPFFITGIGDLGEDLQARSLEDLGRIIRNGSIDLEFKIMVGHYYAVSDWYFDLYSASANVSACIPYVGFNASDFNFTSRGGMGEYWLSLANR